MIGVASKIPFFILNRNLGWPKMVPINLTITPSIRCNSRCATCNIWKKREDELSLTEWERIFQSLGRTPFWFTISGGEPFLYKDIVELCQLAYTHCRPGIINIPTNSLAYQTTAERVDAICRACPDSQVIINLSLDGVGEKHDRIRGVKGNFEKFQQNLAALTALKHPNLSVGIHSVISRFNVDDFAELASYALKSSADSFITEIAEQRVELDTIGLPITPSAEQYAPIVDKLIQSLNSKQFNGISKVTEAFRVEYYRLVKRVLAEQNQPIPCFAGWASAQIYCNGDVWPCCVRAESIGNLRTSGYDFRQIWFSPRADQGRKSIKAKACHCPLANASYTNMLLHPATLFRVASKVIGQSLPLPFGPGKRHQAKGQARSDEKTASAQ